MCIIMCMRTNIDLNDELMSEAGKYSTARTKRGLVEEALETYIIVKAEQKKRQTYRERLDGLRSRTASIRLRSRPHEIVRKDRDTR